MKTYRETENRRAGAMGGGGVNAIVTVKAFGIVTD